MSASSDNKNCASPPSRDSLASVKGFVSSFESMGAADGPGMRLVVFMQGCSLRCTYCHNPETWNTKAGQHITAHEILKRYKRNRAFYQEGGITLSGGEPLLQSEFAAAIFALAHASAPVIHTTLDTAGSCYNTHNEAMYHQLLEHTDLVLLDIKHAEYEGYKKLTGASPQATFAFADKLAQLNVPTIIRQVMVEGITDTPQQLTLLGKMMKRWPNVIGFELLPYHTLGIHKYQELGITYPLKGMQAFDAARIPQLNNIVLAAYKA